MRTDPSSRDRRSSFTREAGIRLAFVVAALVLGTLALEAVTRVVFDRHGMHYALEMWKYARQVKQPSRVAAMGHEHAPNRRAVLMGVEVETNSLGLRDREFAVPKPPGVRRILVLGDSMTFGWGARAEDTYPKVLERLLAADGSPVEVINTGVGNYNTAQEVAYFKERGLQLEPDEVVLGFFINDAEPTPTPSEDLIARHSYAYVVASSFGDALARRFGWKPSLTAYYDGLYDEDHPGWQACREALVELSRLSRRHGITLTIALIPELHAPDEHYPFKRAHARVAEVAAQEGVPVIDLLPWFAGIPPESLWVSPGDAHANARAHEIIARALHGALSPGSKPNQTVNSEESRHE